MPTRVCACINNKDLPHDLATVGHMPDRATQAWILSKT
jgi:hypothetical protein